ncbi:MAG TPA: hypothetical protein VK668_01340 [Mucilaginibacter sp.]|nr:hypothetical protein [Mucilaginibacter sp.]
MSEGGESRKVRKTGSPKIRKKPEVSSPKSERTPVADSLAPSEIEKLPTENRPLQTEQMEVHHHPDLHHEKKAWKEYILEGLMIFLAVTMGFFAETIREGISDRAKGQEYIRSFVEDLRADTTSFSDVIAFDKKKLEALSNLSSCYDAIEKDSKSDGCLVPIIKNSVSNRFGNFTDGTMLQLKNAGGFRLLNKSDKDSIVAYDHVARAYSNFEATIFQQRQDIVRDINVKLIDFKAERTLVPDLLKGNAKSPILLANNKALINEYFNDLLLYNRTITVQISQLGRLSKKATGLIKHFEEKYDLE